MRTGTPTRMSKSKWGNVKAVRPMSKRDAERKFPGYPLEERIAVTRYIHGQALEAKARGDMTTFLLKMDIVKRREGAGLGGF